MYRYLLISFMAIVLTSCLGNEGEERFVMESEPWLNYGYEPVIMSREDFEKEVGTAEARGLEKPGKIYVLGKYLFVNEKGLGFHVYDNSIPESPQKIQFLKARGATDIAIKGKYFYVNQATDLITFYFDEAQNTYTLMNRVRNVFPQKISPDGRTYGFEEDQIIVDWVQLNNY